MDKIALIAAGGLLFGFLCWQCVRQHAVVIQEDLLRRSAEALIAAGIPSAGLSFDGRDATIAGIGGSPQMGDRAQKIVADIHGVRVVNRRILAIGVKE